jgi:MYXO-CTERM domain-containing protein
VDDQDLAGDWSEMWVFTVVEKGGGCGCGTTGEGGFGLFLMLVALAIRAARPRSGGRKDR